MTINKYHWYDGWFYDIVIAPNQDKLFGQIKNLIEPNSKIIDIGCGTGRLEFALADKCESVLGIDLSERNIAVSYTHLRAHETRHDLVCRLLLEKKKNKKKM